MHGLGRHRQVDGNQSLATVSGLNGKARAINSPDSARIGDGNLSPKLSNQTRTLATITRRSRLPCHQQ